MSAKEIADINTGIEQARNGFMTPLDPKWLLVDDDENEPPSTRNTRGSR